MSSYFINNINNCPQPGTVSAYLGTNDPDGWVIADGVARTNNSVYDNLVTMGIGTRSGSNYTPPNYRGAFLRGTGTSNISTAYSGPALNTSQTDDNKSHNHTINDPGHTHIMGQQVNFKSGSNIARDANLTQNESPNYTGRSFTDITVNSSGSESRPFNFGVNWIIKL
jgi:hypothetical protein